MKIGIIVAMASELALVREQLAHQEAAEHNGYEFFTGQIGQNDVVAVKCGIGKVNAAIATMTLIDCFHPDVVVNTGVAGGLGRTQVADVVVADEVAYHDVWCGDGNERGQVQGLPARYGCHGLERLNASAVGPEVRRGLIASGDRFITTPREVAEILDIHPDAVAVDMESGAIAQVCHLKDVPFACIRVVSDTPGIENHFSQYLDFWAEAPKSTFAVLKQLLG